MWSVRSRRKRRHEDRRSAKSPFISHTDSLEGRLGAFVRDARWSLAIFVALLALLAAALVLQGQLHGIVSDIAGIVAFALLLVVLWCFWILFVPWSA